ncbi:MAG: ecdysteroid 22-kinase family protein [Myxococcales bacterium]|nr:ecdysteroid 22-kinase family protein [Myxococcales bacterium]
MPGDFPKTIDAIGVEWLTEALHAAGALPEHGAVVELSSEPVGEQGQTGEVAKLTLRYEGERGQAPLSLVAKVPPPFEQIRQQMHAMGLYQREVRFYQDIGDEAGISVPHCYFAGIDDDSGDFLLLLEDMSACREGDFWLGSLEDTRTAVDALAGMHARWWNSPKLVEFPWLVQHDDADYNVTMLGAVIKGTLPVVEQRFAEHFTGYIRDAARKLEENWASLTTWQPEWPFTLTHNDYHPKQFFFPTEAGGRFAVFDWQSVASSAPTNDLARILIYGLRPDALREHRAELLARYRRGLSERGVNYDAKQLEYDCRKSMLFSLFIMIFACATSDVSILEEAARKRGMNYLDRVFTDLGQNLEDNRVLEVLA